MVPAPDHPQDAVQSLSNIGESRAGALPPPPKEWRGQSQNGSAAERDAEEKRDCVIDRREQLRAYCALPDGRGRRELLLVDSLTGEVFSHALLPEEQKIVVLAYLSRDPDKRTAPEVESLLRYFFDKPVFKEIEPSVLESDLRTAELHRYHQGAFVATPYRHAIHVLEGHLGQCKIDGIGQDFTSTEGSKAYQTLIRWISDLRHGVTKAAKDVAPGQTVCSIHEVAECRVMDSRTPEGCRTLSSDSLGKFCPGVLHCDSGTGGWHCYFANSRYVTVMKLKLPIEDLGAEAEAVRRLGLDEDTSSSNDEKRELEEFVTNRRKGLRQRKRRGNLNAGQNFRDVDAQKNRVVDALLDGIKVQYVPRSRMLLATGEEPRDVYVLVEGEVHVMQRQVKQRHLIASGPKGGGIEVSRITEAGTWMGALSCFESRRERFNYVVASTQGAKVKAIPAANFMQVFARSLGRTFWEQELARERLWLEEVRKVHEKWTRTPPASAKVKQAFTIPKECAYQCCADISKLAKSKPPPQPQAQLQERRQQRKLRHREEFFQNHDIAPEDMSRSGRRKSDAGISAKLDAALQMHTALLGASLPVTESNEEAKSVAASRKKKKKNLLTDWLLSESSFRHGVSAGCTDSSENDDGENQASMTNVFMPWDVDGHHQGTNTLSAFQTETIDNEKSEEIAQEMSGSEPWGDLEKSSLPSRALSRHASSSTAASTRTSNARSRQSSLQRYSRPGSASRGQTPIMLSRPQTPVMNSQCSFIRYGETPAASTNEAQELEHLARRISEGSRRPSACLRRGNQSPSQCAVSTACQKTADKTDSIGHKSDTDFQIGSNAELGGYAPVALEDAPSMSDWSKLLEQRLASALNLWKQESRVRFRGGWGGTCGREDAIPQVKESADPLLVLSPQPRADIADSDAVVAKLVATSQAQPARPSSSGSRNMRRPASAGVRHVPARKVQRPKTPDASSRTLHAWRSGHMKAFSKGLEHLSDCQTAPELIVEEDGGPEQKNAGSAPRRTAAVITSAPKRPVSAVRRRLLTDELLENGGPL